MTSCGPNLFCFGCCFVWLLRKTCLQYFSSQVFFHQILMDLLTEFWQDICTLTWFVTQDEVKINEFCWCWFMLTVFFLVTKINTWEQWILLMLIHVDCLVTKMTQRTSVNFVFCCKFFLEWCRYLKLTHNLLQFLLNSQLQLFLQKNVYIQVIQANQAYFWYFWLMFLYSEKVALEKWKQNHSNKKMDKIKQFQQGHERLTKGVLRKSVSRKSVSRKSVSTFTWTFDGAKGSVVEISHWGFEDRGEKNENHQPTHLTNKRKERKSQNGNFDTPNNIFPISILNLSFKLFWFFFKHENKTRNQQSVCKNYYSLEDRLFVLRQYSSQINEFPFETRGLMSLNKSKKQIEQEQRTKLDDNDWWKLQGHRKKSQTGNTERQRKQKSTILHKSEKKFETEKGEIIVQFNQRQKTHQVEVWCCEAFFLKFWKQKTQNCAKSFRQNLELGFVVRWMWGNETNWPWEQHHSAMSVFGAGSTFKITTIVGNESLGSIQLNSGSSNVTSTGQPILLSFDIFGLLVMKKNKRFAMIHSWRNDDTNPN